MKAGDTIEIYIALPGQMLKLVAKYPLVFLADHQAPVPIGRIPWAGPFDVAVRIESGS